MKRRERDLDLHGPIHERWSWFSHLNYAPDLRGVDKVRQAFYNDYEHVTYNADTLAWIGYVKPGADFDVSRAAAKKQGIRLLILRLPLPRPERTPDKYGDEPPVAWDPVWGEDPRE